MNFVLSSLKSKCCLVLLFACYECSCYILTIIGKGEHNNKIRTSRPSGFGRVIRIRLICQLFMNASFFSWKYKLAVVSDIISLGGHRMWESQ